MYNDVRDLYVANGPELDAELLLLASRMSENTDSKKILKRVLMRIAREGNTKSMLEKYERYRA